MNTKVKSLSCMALTLMLFAIPISGQDNRELPTKNDNAQIIAMLKNFYTLYVAKDLSVFRNADILRNKYFTEGFFKKLEAGRIEDEMYPDCEPVLNAQDRDTSLMKNIKINPVAKQQGAYEICYWMMEEPICVTLFIVKINGKYLINDIDTLY